MVEKHIFNFEKLLDQIGTSLSDFEEIKKDDIAFFILGKGNFGFAEKMKSKKNSIIYAIKKLDKKKHIKDICFKRETEISIKLDHPNLVKFYGYFEDKEKIDKFRFVYKDDKKRKVTETEDKEIYCLVLEFAENGSLKDYFKNYKEKNRTEKSFTPLPQEIITKFLKQSLDALKYLHANNIIHRDISLDNILLGENYTIKISDFGISAKLKDNSEKNDDYNNDNNNDKDNENEEEILDDESLYCKFTICGRKDMVPPEIENGTCYDYRFDIYCLGLAFLCLISEKHPIQIIKNENNEYKGKKVHDEYIFKNYYNNYLIKLIKRMLEKDINYRPTSSQCYEELEYIEKLINNPDDENAKKYLEEINKLLYRKRAASEVPKKHDNYKIYYVDKPPKHQTIDKTSFNPNNNSNVNNCSNLNNTNFNNSNNCSNNNLYNINNNNFNTNINNNYQNFNTNINNNYNNNFICNTNNINNSFNNNFNNNNNINNNFNNSNFNCNTIVNNNFNNSNFNCNTIVNNNFNNNFNNNNNINNNFNNNNFNCNTMVNNIFNNSNFNCNTIVNNNFNNNNFNYNTMVNNIFNNNNFNNNFDRRHSASYSYQSPFSYINNQSYYSNQSKLHHISNNKLLFEFKNDNFKDMQNMMTNLNINVSINSSLVSALQCASDCLERYDFKTNLKYVQENFIKDNIFLLNIANIFEKLSKISENKQDEINFANSIQNFSNQAKSFNLSLETDENNPFQALSNLFNYLNGEYRKNKCSYINSIFRKFTELDILPKNKFPNVYAKINYFTENLHSHIVDAFYYILLHLTRCPKCNNVLKADFSNKADISWYIPLPGNSNDKISNLINNYITSQKNSDENSKCDNCGYEGPGKNELGFLNTPKYLLINIEGENKEIKNIDDTLDLSKYSLTKIGKKKYNIFCFVTKENDKFRTYVKNDQNEWCFYTTENAKINSPATNTSNCIPYIVIYEAEL